MPSKVFKARFESECPICHEDIEPEMSVCFLGPGDKRPMHEQHLYASPPSAASSRVEGSKAVVPPPPATPSLTVAQPAETLLKDVSTAARVFVEVGGWVPNDRAMEVVEAIVRARRLP